jgi:hypothetical protein
MPVIQRRPKTHRFVNGTCIGIQDLGDFEAHYGTVRRVKYTFRTNERDEYGEPHTVHRVFNDDMRRTAWQRKAIHAWLGRAIPNDDVWRFDRKTLIGTSCRLKLKPVNNSRYGVQDEVEIYGPPAQHREKRTDAAKAVSTNPQ